MTWIDLCKVRSPWSWLLLMVTLAPVLIVTLVPADISMSDGVDRLCLICGSYGTASLIRNVVLFVPLGVALALLLGPSRWAFVTVLAMTVGIESTQIYVPGRNPLLADVVANFAGGAISVLLVRWAPWWLGGPRLRGVALSLGCAVAATVVLGSTAWLFTLSLPASTYWGQWTSALRHLEHYDGSVLSASVGGIPASSWRLEDSEAVRAALLEGRAVRVEVEAGTATSGIAPIFSIFDGQRREILLLGIDGDDLMARARGRARELHFDAPDMRIPGAFRGVAPGDTVRLEVAFRGGASCLGLDDRRDCAVGPRLEEGWALLMFPGGMAPWFRGLIEFGWMMALFLPWAFFARRSVVSVGGGLLLVGAACAGWWLAGVAPPSVAAVMGMAAGVGAGGGVGVAIRRWLYPRTGRSWEGQKGGEKAGSGRCGFMNDRSFAKASVQSSGSGWFSITFPPGVSGLTLPLPPRAMPRDGPLLRFAEALQQRRRCGATTT